MSQISNSVVQAPTITAPRQNGYGRTIGLTMALATAIILAAFVLLPEPALPQAGRTTSSTLTDGYLPGAVTAQAAARAEDAQALTDGWAPRLGATSTGASGPGAVQDGWEAGLLR
jgi:hypothetical protein